LDVLPFTQVIDVFFAAAGLATVVGVAVGEGVGVGAATSCESFTLIFGVEKVNPATVIFSHPSFSEITVVATDGVPSELDTSIFS
jgi:hypothetical protein